jgi:hypothetical protein
MKIKGDLNPLLIRKEETIVGEYISINPVSSVFRERLEKSILDIYSEEHKILMEVLRNSDTKIELEKIMESTHKGINGNDKKIKKKKSSKLDKTDRIDKLDRSDRIDKTDRSDDEY